ncbi:hypothetical protein HYU18_01555 [Candidatus Woesearchaeota archaeon]|nr:hypothetical protein [Candidatus Woesearchaeota archaeon]
MIKADVTFEGKPVDVAGLVTAKGKPLSAGDISSLTDAELKAVAGLFGRLITEKARKAAIAFEAARLKGLERYFGTGAFSAAVESLDSFLAGVPLGTVSVSNRGARLLVKEGNYAIPVVLFPTAAQGALLNATSDLASYLPGYERLVGSAETGYRLASDAVAKSQDNLNALAVKRPVLASRRDYHADLARSKGSKFSHGATAYELSAELKALDAMIEAETRSIGALENVREAASDRLAGARSLLKPFGKSSSLEELTARLTELSDNLRRAGLVQSTVPLSSVNLDVSCYAASPIGNAGKKVVFGAAAGLILAWAVVLPKLLSNDSTVAPSSYGQQLTAAEVNALSAYASEAGINLWGGAVVASYNKLSAILAATGSGQLAGASLLGDKHTPYFSIRDGAGNEKFYAVIPAGESVEGLDTSIKVGFDKALVMGQWYKLKGVEFVDAGKMADCGDGETVFAFSFSQDVVKAINCVYQLEFPPSSDPYVDSALAKGGLVVQWPAPPGQGDKPQVRTIWGNGFKLEGVPGVVFTKVASGTDIADSYVTSVSGFSVWSDAPGNGGKPYSHLVTLRTPAVTFDAAHAALLTQQEAAAASELVVPRVENPVR